MSGFHPPNFHLNPLLLFLEMNMIAAMVDNSDWTDDGDVGCKDVELFLRDLLPPLPVVVVDQPPPNKVPGQVVFHWQILQNW